MSAASYPDAADPAHADPAHADHAHADHAHADPVAEALQAWRDGCEAAGWANPCGDEEVAIERSLGRSTSGNVLAAWSLPAYRAAAMDGIAIRASTLTAGGSGSDPLAHVPVGEFEPVDTGDVVADRWDAVVPCEVVVAHEDGSVTVPRGVTPGRHVRPVGEDIAAGALVLRRGQRIGPVELAAVAAVGHRTVVVRRRPVVAVLPTGDEVRPLGSRLCAGEVLDTNSLMLAGFVEQAGGVPVGHPIVADRPDELASAIRAAAEDADLVLVIAGSSAGRDDHTAAVLRDLGRVLVHGIAIRPGHPTALGVLIGDRAVPVVGVPGYPVSAERAFHCFVRPMIDAMLLAEPSGTCDIDALLATDVRSAGHVEEHLRVRVARITDPVTGRDRYVALPLGRGAGALGVMVAGHGVMRIPVGTIDVAAGTPIRVTVRKEAPTGDGTIVLAGRWGARSAALVSTLRDRSLAAVHWLECDARQAGQAVETGLCHAVVADLGPDGEFGARRMLDRATTGRMPVDVLHPAGADRGRLAVVVPRNHSRPEITDLRAVVAAGCLTDVR